MRLTIRHETVYRYDAAATYSIQLLKLSPRKEAGQRIESWSLRTSGRKVEQIDAFGNVTHLLTLEGAHREVRASAEGIVETWDGFTGTLPLDSALSPLAYLAPTALTRPDAAIEALARQIFPLRGSPTNADLERLMETVYGAVSYRPGTTEVTDTAADVVARGVGVCQDQAHTAVAICRAAGIPARYVSGYVLSDGPNHAASHAWLDVWVAEDLVWRSCDVTHRTFTGPGLCRLAVGRDYLDAAPVRGVRRGGGHEAMDVRVNVSALPQQ